MAMWATARPWVNCRRRTNNEPPVSSKFRGADHPLVHTIKRVRTSDQMLPGCKTRRNDGAGQTGYVPF